MILDRLFKRRLVAQPVLHGAPPVRRQKTYSAQTGFVYQYYYEGYRESERAGRPGNEYVFQISSDRKASFPLTVFLPRAAVEAWQQGHGRQLIATEQYAAVKMALFEVFDERADLGPANAEVEIAPADMERLLGVLDID
ncbi:MAG TPA: hypothetical protein VEU62_04735 [Bryobacterales bacterium]|nr:hypothetical protein [Bryobacterales bacterium]